MYINADTHMKHTHKHVCTHTQTNKQTWSSSLILAPAKSDWRFLAAFCLSFLEAPSSTAAWSNCPCMYIKYIYTSSMKVFLPQPMYYICILHIRSTKSNINQSICIYICIWWWSLIKWSGRHSKTLPKCIYKYIYQVYICIHMKIYMYIYITTYVYT